MAIEFKGLREQLQIKHVRDELLAVLKVVSVFSNRKGIGRVRITSLNDHSHMKRSKHYEDLAVDFVVLTARGTPNRRAMKSLAKHLKSVLPFGYDVLHGSAVQHPNHVHVEWDDTDRSNPDAN